MSPAFGRCWRAGHRRQLLARGGGVSALAVLGDVGGHIEAGDLRELLESGPAIRDARVSDGPPPTKRAVLEPCTDKSSETGVRSLASNGEPVDFEREGDPALQYARGVHAEIRETNRDLYTRAQVVLTLDGLILSAVVAGLVAQPSTVHAITSQLGLSTWSTAGAGGWPSSFRL